MGRVSNHVRSNVVGYVALFMALCGTAYAVDGPLAGQNTVGSADIIDSDVRTEDIRDANLTTADIRADAVTTGKVLNNTLTPADIADVDVLRARTVRLNDQPGGGSDNELLMTIGRVDLIAICFANGGQLQGGVELGVDEPGAFLVVDGEAGLADQFVPLGPFDVQFLAFRTSSTATGQEVSFGILDPTKESATGVSAVALDPSTGDCVISTSASG